MAQALNTPYGAFELKQSYQRNMMYGTLATVALVILVGASVWLYRIITYEELVPTNVHRIKTIAELGAPPSLVAKPPQVQIDKPIIAPPKVGIPTAVDDDEVLDEDVVIASREELQDINAPVFEEGDGSELVIDIPDVDYMPTPDEFVAYEVSPQMILEVKPEYPRLAQESGFAAKVIVEAYVDKNGNVKKAQAKHCTRPNMGFEESAVKAAYDYKYKPAIQNGAPIGCWISYTVKFEF